MADGRIAKIFLTVLAALGGGLWGYVLPGSFSKDWRWRLIALPAAFLVAAIVWTRSQVETAVFAVDVPMGLRIVVTVSMSIAGLGSGFIIPLVLTRSWPPVQWGLLLGVTLAAILGNVAWRYPALFFKDRPF
jgi:hypothetical protein